MMTPILCHLRITVKTTTTTTNRSLRVRAASAATVAPNGTRTSVPSSSWSSSSSSSSSSCRRHHANGPVPTQWSHRSCCTKSALAAILDGSVTSVRPTGTSALTSITLRSHYTYSGPGRFGSSDDDGHPSRLQDHHDHNHDHDHDDQYGNRRRQSWTERGFTVGIGGPVGSGKTALVLALIRRLADPTNRNRTVGGKPSVLPLPPLGVVTNDIFTQEDAQFLHKNQCVLDRKYILAVETGGCPHAAIREDVSANLTACEDLTTMLVAEAEASETTTTTETSSNSSSSTARLLPPLILCESGGDNLAANFSKELADLTLYVIDVAGGDKVPRKGGPGITRSDLLVINKIDLAEAVGADLNIMKRDADLMRKRSSSHDEDDNDGNDKHSSGPTVFASVRHGTALDDIETFILQEYHKAVSATTIPKP